MIITTAAQTIVVIFALLVLTLSAIGVVAPRFLLRFGLAVWSASSGMLLAIASRLILGGALLVAAPFSRFPDTFRALGAITVLAALALPLVGRERLKSLIDWASQLPLWALRLWTFVGVLFGAFLLYATTTGTPLPLR